MKDKLGRVLKDLRVSVIDACNFRCTYCMPADKFDHYSFLKNNQLLTFAEIHRLVTRFVDLGVTKIRLTGGEPLLRKNIEELISMLSSIPGIEDIAMTTNGYLLAEKVHALKDAGLKRVTVSLDSLSEEVFKKMAGRNVDLHKVLEGIDAAQSAGLVPLKIDTVVQRGVNDKDVLQLARYFKGKGITVRYIEFMDVGNINSWHWDKVVPSKEIVAIIDKEFPLEPLEERSSDPAKRFRYKDGSGEIGFISSVSQPFCQSCVRARLSADGQFYTCLFATQGIDLRSILRSYSSCKKLDEVIKTIWSNRADRYSEVRYSLSANELRERKKVEMFAIGG